MAAGKSGTPGAVTCDSSSCDDEEKPDAKQCPKTDNCGTFDTDVAIVHSLHHHHLQPSQTTTNQPTRALAIFPLRSHLGTAELIFVYDGIYDLVFRIIQQPRY